MRIQRGIRLEIGMPVQPGVRHIRQDGGHAYTVFSGLIEEASTEAEKSRLRCAIGDAMRIRGKRRYGGDIHDAPMVLLQHSKQLLRKNHRHLQVHAHHLRDVLCTKLLMQPVVGCPRIVDKKRKAPACLLPLSLQRFHKCRKLLRILKVKHHRMEMVALTQAERRQL